MSDNFYRRFRILQLVPHYPRKISTRRLKEILEKEDIRISQRTIQRDLKFLSEKWFPHLTGDENLELQGWFWEKDSTINDFPVLNPVTSLLFQLTKRFLADKLPSTITNSLQPYFDCSERRLREIQHPNYLNLLKKIRIIPNTQPLIPAEINQQHLETIYEALMQERQIQCRYKSREGNEAGYDMHPLGLVFRDSVMYLIATLWEYQDPRQFALHRFVTCEMSDKTANTPAQFSLDQYVSEGNFEYLRKDDSIFEIVLLFEEEAGAHLLDTPLSNDQVVMGEIDGRIRIEATVKNSSQLRWWLLGFGEYVEVIKPGFLRDEFASISNGMAQIYSKGDS